MYTIHAYSATDDGLLPCIVSPLSPHACIFIELTTSAIQYSEGMMFNGAWISVVFAFACIKRRHSHAFPHTEKLRAKSKNRSENCVISMTDTIIGYMPVFNGSPMMWLTYGKSMYSRFLRFNLFVCICITCNTIQARLRKRFRTSKFEVIRKVMMLTLYHLHWHAHTHRGGRTALLNSF